MLLQSLRRLARPFLAGRAQPSGPLPGPASGHGAALERLGATRLPGPWHVRAGRDASRATADTFTLPGTALLAVAATITVSGGPARLRLHDPSGTTHDTLTLPPRAAPWQAWLFAPRGSGAALDLHAAGTRTRMRLDSAASWAVPSGALDPTALVPRPPLEADPGWTRAYGPADPEDALARLRQHAFSRLAEPVLVPFLDGMRLWLEPGDELSRAVLLTGNYEPETLLAVRALLPEGGVFVDVGAHCGLISVVAAHRVGPRGRVLSFEPSPREFARLQANLAANALSHATAHRAAVAATDGTVTLRLAEPGHAGHNTIGRGFAYQGVATAALEQVRAITLDAALAGLERCDLIKMDIEGAELAALRGGATALARLRPALILEVFDRALANCGDTEPALFAWLAAAGYDARTLDPATARFTTQAHPLPNTSRNIVALPRPASP